MNTPNPPAPTEPGWITTDPRGVVEFWPSSSWNMEEETDIGYGWEHWLTHRTDAEQTRTLPRGYGVQTAIPTDEGIVVMDGWRYLNAPITSSVRNRDIKDVHTEHCCSTHGCKYSLQRTHALQRTPCTVVSGEKPQSHPCEYCYRDREEIAIWLPRIPDAELIAEVYRRGLDNGSQIG